MAFTRLMSHAAAHCCTQRTGMIPLYCCRMASDTVTASTLCIVLYGTGADFGRYALFSSALPAQMLTNASPSSIRMVRTLIVYAVNRFLLTT